MQNHWVTNTRLPNDITTAHARIMQTVTFPAFFCQHLLE